MNKLVAASLLAVSAALLSGCGSVHGRYDGPTGAQWQLESGGHGSCQCPTATERFVANRGTAIGTIDVYEHRNLVYENGSSTEKRNFPDVPINERRFLHCSAEPAGAHLCGATYSWTFDGNTYHGDSRWAAPAKHQGGLLAWIRNLTGGTNPEPEADPRLMAAVNGEKIVMSDASCVSRCRSNDPTCLRVDLRSEGRDYAGPFYQEFRAAANGGQIPVTRLLTALGERENICKRGDILVQARALSNSGLACTWSGPAAFTEVNLSIPETLAGKLSVEAGQLSLTFLRPRLHGPSVHFKDPALQADFGGYVSRADEMVLTGGSTPARYVVLSGPKNCLALRTN